MTLGDSSSPEGFVEAVENPFDPFERQVTMKDDIFLGDPATRSLPATYFRPPPGHMKPPVPLKERRKVNLELPPTGSGRQSSEQRMDRELSVDLESLTPSVLSTTAGGPGWSLRPFPGAFPLRRTLIFLDWDDTLCPTTWIRKLLTEHIADSSKWVSETTSKCDWRDQVPAWFGQPLPDEPAVRESIAALQDSVISLLNAAQAMGSVCIITNSVSGWVDKTMKKWLPRLTQHILGHGMRPPIPVYYGQREYQLSRPGTAAAKLSWIDECGELMWWKKAAMQTALENIDKIYRVVTRFTGNQVSAEEPPQVPWQGDSGSRGVVNLLSIGDNEAEMQAPVLAAVVSRSMAERSGNIRPRRATSAPPGPQLPRRPWVKSLKLLDAPGIDQLRQQLDLFAKALPQMVLADSHLALTPDDLPALQPDLSELPPAMQHIVVLERQLQRHLYSQTV